MASKEDRSQDRMTIRVGAGWTRFAYEREGIELLGVVVYGQAIGALGRLPDGSYVQVNGDVVSALNASRVKLALRREGVTTEGGFPAGLSPANQGAEHPTPAVLVKKRRSAVPAVEARPIETAAKAQNTSRRQLTLKKGRDAPSPKADSADTPPSSE